MQALAMGGYGGYVWAAFGFTLISMIGLLWQSWRAQHRRTGELAALRSTVRGSGRGARPQGEQPAETAPRRLVATKPARRGGDAAEPEAPPAPGFAATRPSSGT